MDTVREEPVPHHLPPLGLSSRSAHTDPTDEDAPKLRGGEEGVRWDANFMIPELPTGSELVFNLKSTWGVGHYIGLTGIEVLDERGQLIHLSDPKRQLVAEPASINVLPQFQGINDPRCVHSKYGYSSQQHI